jgi:hypothetical protein
VFFCSIFLYLSFTVAGKGMLADADTGYHIRAGEYILDTFSVPKSDIFSHLSPPIPWTAHEWLSEAVMAIVHRLSGLTGVVLFFSFFIALTYSLLFRAVRAQGGNLIVALVLVLLAVTSSQMHWLARPHVFSLLITLVWCHVLNIYQYRDRNCLYLLPPLMLLWVNLHGGFVMGFVLLGVYLAANLAWAVSLEGGERKMASKKAGYLALTALAAVLASLVNPYGHHILLFPLKLTSNKFLMDHVHEFLSPNFHEPLPFKYLLLAAIALLALSRKGLDLIEFILVMMLTYMSLYSVRYVLLFALILTPVLAGHAEALLGRYPGRLAGFLDRRGQGLGAVDASARGYVWPAAAVLSVTVFAATGAIGYNFDSEIKPVKAVEFMEREGLRGSMFNNDEFGDYIIYAAWPRYRVFFDGRSDMYGVDRLKEYIKVTEIGRGWEDVLKKYSMNWVIYNSDSVLSRHLQTRSDWRLIYSDKLASIFVRDVPEYRHIIEKHPGVKPYIKKEEEGGTR